MTTLHSIPRHWRETWSREPLATMHADAAHGLEQVRAAFAARHHAALAPGAGTSLSFVAGLCLVVGALAALPDIVAVDRGWWQTRFLLPLSLAGLVVWLLADRRPPARVTVFATATTAACFALLALLPERATDSVDVFARMPDAVWLASAHVPVVLLGVAGVAFCGDRWRAAEARIAFVRFAAAVVAIASVLVVGGLGVGLLALFVYGALGIDLTDWYLRWVMLPGAIAAPVLAAWICERLPGRAEDLARPLARIFAPPLLLVAATFPVVLFADGGNDLQQREVLRQVHGLLAVVLAAAFLAMATRRGDDRLRASDAIPAGLLLTALVIDLIALAGLLPRIATWGLTPNRAVAAGVDLVVLGHLVVLLRIVVRQAHRGGVGIGMQAVLGRWLPVYAAWAAFVAFGVPAMFGVR